MQKKSHYRIHVNLYTFIETDTRNVIDKNWYFSSILLLQSIR